MKTIVFNNKIDLQKVIVELKKDDKKIGFVPTMGALHEGHLSLILESQMHSDYTVCSVFVNPTQFNEQTDLDKYPRTLDADVEKLESVNCNFVYAPSVDDVYAEEKKYSYDFEGLDLFMEGPKRPGHFEGVVQVVKRLFEIVQPDVACFGLKDFQQYAIIKHMSDYFKMNIEVVGCSIVREQSGLAMSSRNTRLSKVDLVTACVLNRVLHFVKDNHQNFSVDVIKAIASDWLRKNSDLEYFQICDSKTLKPIESWNEASSPRAFIATWVGGIRLIDNMEIF